MANSERQPGQQLEASIDHLGRIAPDGFQESNQPLALRADLFRAAHHADREARIALSAVERIVRLGDAPTASQALSFIEWAWASMEHRRLLLARQLERSASLVVAGAHDILSIAEDLRGEVSILCSARFSLLGRADIAHELTAIAEKRQSEIAAAAGLAAQVMAFRGGTRLRNSSAG